MEIEINSTTTKKVKIELPYYCTDGFCHWYKVFSEENCIQVMNGNWSPQIGKHHAGLAFVNNAIECTKEDFEENFKKVFNILNEIATK